MMWSAPGRPARVASLIASSGLLRDSTNQKPFLPNWGELTLDIWHDGILVHTNTQYLTFPVHHDYPIRCLILRSSKDSLARYPVHIDTRASLDLVQVDESEFRDKVDDAVLLRDLHGDGEIVCRLGREEDVDLLLLEGWVRSLVTDLHDMELPG